MVTAYAGSRGKGVTARTFGVQEKKFMWSKVVSQPSQKTNGSLSASATEFVPKTPPSGTSAAFVPGYLAWNWQGTGNFGSGTDSSESGRMPLNAWAPTFAPHVAGAGTAAQSTAACWFNTDAYSTDSSSARSTPRATNVTTDVAAGASQLAVQACDTGYLLAPRCPDGSSTQTVVPQASVVLGPANGSVGVGAATPATASTAPAPIEAPAAAQDGASTSEATVPAEMSETALKHWLRRFANDGDTVALGCQWSFWRRHDPECSARVVDWLLGRGLDDSSQAQPVAAIVSYLLEFGDLSLDSTEGVLAAYSQDDLEDLKLDNPKVGEFIAALRTEFAGARRRFATTGCTPSDPSSANDCGVPNSYSLDALLVVRRALGACKGTTGPSDEPRWRTQSATSLFDPAPPWVQRMSQSQSANAKEDPDTSVLEWRGGHRKSAPPEVKGRSQGHAGRPPELMVSSTSWVAQLRRWKSEGHTVDEDSANDEHFIREMRLTLNKLTIERFDQLSDQIIELISRSTRPNRGIPMLMQLVFEKATTQHHFISMYVNLCVKLHQWLTTNVQIPQTEAQNNFRKVLLNQCQSSFEQHLEPPEGLEGLQGNDLYEAQVKYKTKMLGNIKLVGELIRHGMLAPKIAIAVAEELVRDDPAVRHERLETLAVFLKTVGPSLDDPSWSHHFAFNGIFDAVWAVVQDASISSRIRFLFRDVLDLRRARWQVHRLRDLETDAPMTIAQVHRKARQEHAVPPRGNSGRDMGARERVDHPGQAGGARRKGAATKASPYSLVGVDPTAAHVASSPTASSQASPRSAPGSRSSKGTAASPALGPSAAPSVGTGMQVAAAGNGENSQAEVLALFHREIVQTIKLVGNGLDARDAVKRLRGRPLPPGNSLEEAVDLLARLVDEPRPRRTHLFTFFAALFTGGIFTPRSVLSQAVERFVREAFVDSGTLDPPDLADIVLGELLPTLELSPSALSLPACLRDNPTSKHARA